MALTGDILRMVVVSLMDLKRTCFLGLWIGEAAAVYLFVVCVWKRVCERSGKCQSVLARVDPILPILGVVQSRVGQNVT